MHPTWRDLVIERLAADAGLRRHFLARCGPHGLALALSSAGGAHGDRRLPLVLADDDWDAIGDRIYALVPELEDAEVMTVLGALGQACDAVTNDPLGAGEAHALARMAVERLGELWESGHAVLPLPAIEAWLDVAARLNPRPTPTFLAPTRAELLPARLPDAGDLAEVQRFTDWVVLCELLERCSGDALESLGFGAGQRALIQAVRARAHEEADRLALIGTEEPPWELEAGRPGALPTARCGASWPTSENQLHQGPGLDALRGHQAVDHIRVARGEALDVVGRHPLPDHRAAIGGRAQRAGQGDVTRRALGADALQVGLAIGAAALGDVLHVAVEQQIGVLAGHRWAPYRGPAPGDGPGRYASSSMSNLDRRSGYTPRRVREQRAYRMVVAGGTAGAVGVVGLVLAIAGVIGATLPIIAFIVAALCVFGFLRTTGQR